MSRRDPQYPFTLHDPEAVGRDGYPHPWHRLALDELVRLPDWGALVFPRGGDVGVKDVVRARADHRCVRCGHPYVEGGEWSRCDERCTHDGPLRVPGQDGWVYPPAHGSVQGWNVTDVTVEAQWRILTVHHLNGAKWDLRWWNLVSLCQRCHLQIQAKVVMERVYPFEHTEWFKPYAAGWYAAAYLGEELTRAEVEARMDELLALEQMA